MKAELVNLEKKVVGEVLLNDDIFGLESRVDIIKRVVDWQMAKARVGSHSVKTVGEVSGTTKKPFKQKGTGNARQGNARGVQRRGGGIAHGPQIRSHNIKLQKNVRRLGVKHALSDKQSSGSVHILDSIDLQSPKTSNFLKVLSNFGKGKFIVIDSKIGENLRLSSSAVFNACVLPVIGVNVYDIINSDHVLISKAALSSLEERLV